jgi:hypothetical protein
MNEIDINHLFVQMPIDVEACVSDFNYASFAIERDQTQVFVVLENLFESLEFNLLSKLPPHFFVDIGDGYIPLPMLVHNLDRPFNYSGHFVV